MTSRTRQQRRWRARVAVLVAAVALLTAACSGGGTKAGDAGASKAATATTAGPAPGSAPSAAPSTGTTVPPGPATFTLLFGGDLLPHGQVDQAAAAAGRPAGRRYDFAPLLAPMRPIVSAADLALCHMETPVAEDQRRITSYPVFGAPVELVQGIADTGYDGCSTASNHSLDQRQDGIRATLDAFDAAGLGHAGTARTAAESLQTRTYDVKGVKVAHLSYAYGFNGFRPPPGAEWSVNEIDQGRILADAARARREGARFVVVSLHWGEEYQPLPNTQQRALAPALTASPDIDLVVGHHVHVVQPITRMNDKFVIFGLGNQLSSMTQPLRRDGVSARVTVTRRPDGGYAATEVRAVPTYVDIQALKVLPVAETLADPATPAGAKPALAASAARTTAAVNALGPTPGVTIDDGSSPP